MTDDYQALLRQDLPTWRRIRRYAVPGEVIAAATAARLRGDWRAACQAARVDATVDLDQVRREHGHEAADDLADDLAHFAPDLLHWHLPRVLGGRTSLGTRTSVVLSPRGGTTGPLLRVRLPRVVDGPQRLRLDVIVRSDLADRAWFDAPRHLWDARRSHELPAAWGLDMVEAGQLAAQRQEQGDVVATWGAAGIEFDPSIPANAYRKPDLAEFIAYPLWPVGIAREVRRLTERYQVTEVLLAVSWRAQAVLAVSADGNVTARVHSGQDREEMVPIGEPVRNRPADLDLLRHGMIGPDDLHPLIRSALFPHLPPVDGGRPERAGDVAPPVAVRCQGAWHQVQVARGRIQALNHSPEEEQREAMLRALGGTSTGCFATQRAWTEGTGRLPRGLREQRRDLLLHILHGHTDEIVARLDRGQLDPQFRDGRRWTMLHLLTHLDHELLLPRLLAAGVSLAARDAVDRQPLHLALHNGASTEFIRALWRAGADPRAPGQYDISAIELIDPEYRDDQADPDDRDLDFLREPAPTTREPAPTTSDLPT